MKSHLSNKAVLAVQKQTGTVVTYVYIKWWIVVLRGCTTTSLLPALMT